MKTLKKILLVNLLIIFTAFSCEKEEVLPANQAKGKITEKFGWCYGNFLLIEVEIPHGVGSTGTYSFSGSGRTIFYKNAIAVPYFYRIPDLNTNAPDTIGTWIHFEYRKIKSGEEKYFRSPVPLACPANIVSPDLKQFIITKIIDYH